MFHFRQCKHLKRILSIFLALLTVFSVVAVGVGSVKVSAKTNGVFEYVSRGKNEVCLSKAIDMDYTGKTFVIPAEIDGNRVVGVDTDNGAIFFRDLIKSGNIDTITSIKIEEGIVELDQYGPFGDPDCFEEGPDDGDWEDYSQGLFSGMKNLRSISLPKSLKALDFRMFSNCTSLRKITIPDNIEYFNDNIFEGCTSLKYVELPSNMKYIPKKMFKNCKALESIKLPSSIEIIHASAFAYCESLKGRLKLPKNLKVIGEKAFYSCKSLTGKLEIPKNLDTVSDGAFAFCSGLTGFRIADGNKYFSQKGGVLFDKKKTKIYCYLSGKETKEYKVPSTVKAASDYAFAGTKYLKKITLSDKMKYVDGYAFYKSKVKEVNLPKSIDYICEGAFKNCKNLKEIKIPSKVWSVGAYAFNGCSSLKSLTFPKAVLDIYEKAFDNCKNLKSVKIMNKKCDIYGVVLDYSMRKVSGSKPTIYGYKNSTAQKFAKKAKLKFVEIK